MPGDSQPKAIQIVAKNKKTGALELVSKAVEDLLQGDEIKDKKVCVISVAGAFRMGKSFLLNFFVKYLEKACQGVDDMGNWLGSDDDNIAGFAWRGGIDRETAGIWAWSKVFILKKEDVGSDVDRRSGSVPSRDTREDEIAVVLLDTQGIFDPLAPVHECTAVFSIATLISSKMVFNLSRNIKEDDLQYLQLFAEYGRLAKTQSTTTGKPFQSLIFLVRDWPHKEDHRYGSTGGKEFLDKRLAISDDMHSDLKKVRKGIEGCFEELGCCLLPYPGSKVDTNCGFTGELADLGEEFKEKVKEFVEITATHGNLVKKKVDGDELTCGDLAQFLKSYVEAFQGGRIPSAETLLQTTAKAHHETALNDAKTKFQEAIIQVCGAEIPYMVPHELDPKLKNIKSDAEKTFKDYPKVGSPGMNEEYLEKLSNFMMETCKEYKQMNDNKANFIRKTMTYISYYILSSFKSKTPAYRADYLDALKLAEIQFKNDIEKVCGANVSYMNPSELDPKLEDIKSDAEKTFKGYPKVGGQEMEEEYQGKLSNFMRETCEEYQEMNRNKANLLIKAMTLIPFIVSRFVKKETYVKIKGWFISTGIKISSGVGSALDFIATCCSRIATRIEGLMPSLPDMNMRNRVFNALRIPFALILIMVPFTILSIVFGWFGLSQFSTSLFHVVVVALIMLCLWIYLYFTGSITVLEQAIDEIADFIQNAGPQPAQQQHGRQMVDGHDEQRARGGNRRREHMD